VLDEYPERYMVGETADVKYYGNGHNELHSVFDFDLLDLERLTAVGVRQKLSARLPQLPAEAWEANTLSNHDVSRSRSHFGDGAHDAAWTRLTATLTLTLRGSPFIYNGEEIGMQDWPAANAAQFRDMLSVWVYNTVREHMGMDEAQALQVANQKGRDKCRTPMQWGPGPNGDFCPAQVTPWLPVHPNHAQGVNVQQEREDTGSLLQFYQRLIALRKGSSVLAHGDLTLLENTAPGCLAYLRRDDGKMALIALNLSDKPQHGLLTLVKRWLANMRLRCLFSTHDHMLDPESLPGLRLAPFEAYIGEVV
jgi:alpha-glucosidase